MSKIIAFLTLLNVSNKLTSFKNSDLNSYIQINITMKLTTLIMLIGIILTFPTFSSIAQSKIRLNKEIDTKADWTGHADYFFDKNGNYYFSVGNGKLMGERDDNIVSMKFNPQGEKVWEVIEDRGMIDSFVKMLPSKFDNSIVVIGNCYYPSPPVIFIAKYSFDGDVIWRKFYDDRERSYVTSDFVIDSIGNIYIAAQRAFSSSEPSDYDKRQIEFATIKVSSNGTVLWEKRHEVKPFDEVKTINIDSFGNVFTSGSNSTGFITIKHDTSGNPIWVSEYKSSKPARVYPIGILLTADNHIYVGGNLVTDKSSMLKERHEYLIVKYDRLGNELWSKSFNRDDGKNHQAYDLKLDQKENIIISGYSDKGKENDITTIKYSPDGNVLWEHRFTGTKKTDEWTIIRLAIDSQNNVLVAGGSEYEKKNGLVIYQLDKDGKSQSQYFKKAGMGSYSRLKGEISIHDDIIAIGGSIGGMGKIEILEFKYE